MENNEVFFTEDLSEISEEYFAAWLDGNLSEDADVAFLERLQTHPELSQILDSFEDIETEYDSMIEEGFVLPVEFSVDFDLPHVGHSYFNALDEDQFSDTTHLEESDEYEEADNNNSSYEEEQADDCHSDYYEEDSEHQQTDEFDLF